MKTNIKREREYCQWFCTKCGLKFRLFGPNDRYLGPNYCPNCGVPYHKTLTNRKVDDDEDYCGRRERLR